MTLLERFGFSSSVASRFAPFAVRGLVPARVLREERGQLLVLAAEGPVAAVLPGALLHRAASRLDLPAVGDWVALTAPPPSGPAVVEDVVPRSSRIVRKAAGAAARPQVVAANVDVLLALTGLDGDFNVRRIERYVALARESDVVPVVLLTKADLCRDLDARRAQAASAAPGTDVFAVSAVTGEGLDALSPLLSPGRTLAVAGMSGAGKSTLVNRLLGEDLQSVGSVRASDGRGRHTTARRDLILLPGGALLVDTPGMRELALWDGAGESAFEDLSALAASCRFRDCAHGREPGCAVRAAAADGRLDPGRLASFEKLEKEGAWLERRRDAGLARAERERWKGLTRGAKDRAREKRRIGP